MLSFRVLRKQADVRKNNPTFDLHLDFQRKNFIQGLLETVPVQKNTWKLHLSLGMCQTNRSQLRTFLCPILRLLPRRHRPHLLVYARLCVEIGRIFHEWMRNSDTRIDGLDDWRCFHPPKKTQKLFMGNCLHGFPFSGKTSSLKCSKAK